MQRNRGCHGSAAKPYAAAPIANDTCPRRLWLRHVEARTVHELYAMCDGKTGIEGLQLPSWLHDGFAVIDNARRWHMQQTQKGSTK